MNIAVFDLDHTLLQSNVAFEFGKYLYRKGFFSRRKSLFLIAVYLLYKVGFISVQRLHSVFHLHLFKKIPIAELDSLTEMFLEEYLKKLTNPRVADQLQKDIGEGNYTLLLSSSPCFLVERIGSQFGVDESLGTSYTKSGVVDVIDGKVKALFVEHKAQEQGVSLANVVAYTDSVLDLPLLKLVGTPVAVAPSLKLRMYCFLYKWKVF